MTALPLGITQPDARSCGAASLVAARMLLDPTYAELVTAGAHPRTGFALAGGTVHERFGYETLAMHRRVTGAAVLGGGVQLPWPRMIGTPPWAVAHQLSRTGGPGLPPTPYDVSLVRLHPGASGPMVRAGLRTGRPVAVFVGDAWLPRHVVLSVGLSGDSVDCYDPARGRVVAAGTSAFAEQRLPFGRWTTAWFVVAPA
ncbi:MAG: hypothetical protein LH468_09525 [Nocardioides sp.]|nr:hypothetical protein [Nocardioides sp.]